MIKNNKSKKRDLRYFDILLAKKAYIKGENVMELLRNQKKLDYNTSEIIETSYDLQAGSYIKYAIENKNSVKLYTSQLAKILNNYTSSKKSILDIGAGELTTLSFIIKKLINKPKIIYAFDISWSRIFKGLNFAENNMGGGNDFSNLKTFVGDIKEIPLLSKSVDITISNHALEPNGKNLHQLMLELFRVTADKLILFEPCYEINSKEGKKRMDKLGYIKNIDGTIKELNGKILEKIIIKNPSNSLNPTVCFVVSPPKTNAKYKNLHKKNIFSVPGTDFNITKIDNFYFSNATGLCFPILKSIPILKSNIAILASCLSN